MAKYTGPIFKSCDRCENQWAGQFVEFYSDGHREALCFTCWRPLTYSGGGTAQVRVVDWINKYGKLQHLPGAERP